MRVQVEQSRSPQPSTTLRRKGEPSARGLRAPFSVELEHRLLGERVCVQSEQGHRFEGELVRYHPWDRHVLLTDVTEHVSGNPRGDTFVASVDWITTTPVEGDG